MPTRRNRQGWLPPALLTNYRGRVMVKSTRKPISKKLRFEIFKRDKFCCSFCGKSAPDVILEIDHIKPVIDGGKNDILNLTTACFDCNRGKGKRKLSDDSAIKKQLKQLEDLQEKRAQFELMTKWKEELEKFDNTFIKYIEKLGSKLTNNHFGTFTETGRKNLLKLKKKYSESKIIDAYNTSFSQYYNNPSNAKDIKDQIEKSVNYVARILAVEKSTENDPVLKDLFYCRAILRNKSSYINEWRVLEYLKSMIAANWEIEEIKQACKDSRDWNDFHRNTSGD